MSNLKIHVGDCRESMRSMAEKSVHCVVTSPPYWALRDYGTAGQIGLEPTIAEFIESMKSVFAEVWRVLRDDGTCWVNLGDTYSNNPPGARDPDRWPKQSRNDQNPKDRKRDCRIKQKDLCGIPWRVAFALQDAGWYLRSDIIWHKPNPMPESCCDRPTKSHEYIFLLTKKPTYFYDADAISEAVSLSTHARVSQDMANQIGSERANGGAKTNGNMKSVVAGVNPKARRPSGWADSDDGSMTGRYKTKQNESFSSSVVMPVMRRNKRTVWTIPTRSFRDAHFATYPEDLVKPCILAGTSARGVCADCGSPYERVVEAGAASIEWQKACGGSADGTYKPGAGKDFTDTGAQDARATKQRILEGMREKITVDWKATCDCAAAIVPATVLDPFFGSGTTGRVAIELGRHAVGCELNPEYAKMASARCDVTPGLAL